jgi:uncharacterized protein YqeY
MADSLIVRLEQDLKTAMKERKAAHLRTLRGLKSALQKKELEKGRGSMSEEDVIAVLQKQARQRKEALSQFEAGGRDDLAEREKEELAIIGTYLPEELSQAELEEIVLEAVNSVSAPSPSDMGRVMGLVMPKVRGRADGNRVRELVSRTLSS